MDALIITGNTYPHRRALAQLGAKWSRDREAWVAPLEARAAAEALADAHGLKVYVEGEIEAAELAPMTEAQRRERQAEKMLGKADRLRGKAARRAGDASQLLASAPRHESDYAWLTQPVVGAGDVRRFVRRREKAAEASVEARDAAARAASLECAVERQETPAFMQRRIDDAEAALRRVGRRKAGEGMRRGEPPSGDDLARLDAEEARQADIAAYWRAQLEAAGGVAYSKATVRPGDLVRVRGREWCLVLSCGPKRVKVATYGLEIPYLYAEITEHRAAGQEVVSSLE